MVTTPSPDTQTEKSLSDLLSEQIAQLSPSQQQEVLNFVEFLQYKKQPKKTIWDKIAERVAQLPPEVIEQLPTDSSENLDHYLYGAPKK
jgi:hypothetical protein